MTHDARIEMGMATDQRRWSSEPILGDWIPQLLSNLRAQRARRHLVHGQRAGATADQTSASTAGPSRRDH